MSSQLIVSTWLGDAAGSLEAAAALTVVAAQAGGPGESAALLIELGDGGPCKPTILASAPARGIEKELSGAGAAARGRICHLRLQPDREGLEGAATAIAALSDRPLCLLHAPPYLLRRLLECPALAPRGAVLRANLATDRSLAALTVGDLCARGIRSRIVKRRLGWLAGRRALAGLPPGDNAERLARRLLSGLLGPDGSIAP